MEADNSTATWDTQGLRDFTMLTKTDADVTKFPLGLAELLQTTAFCRRRSPDGRPVSFRTIPVPCIKRYTYVAKFHFEGVPIDLPPDGSGCPSTCPPSQNSLDEALLAPLTSEHLATPMQAGPHKNGYLKKHG